ncbi:universal stress protein [soil metagenome]
MAAESPIQHLVVPIDVAGDSRMAAGIVRGLVHSGDEVTFLHVIQPLETAGVLLPKSVPIESITRGIREDARQRLAQQVAEAQLPDDVQVRSIIVDGNPGEEIVHYASRPEITMVVMETAGRGAATRMMIGSVADHVARSASVPVLLVRESADGGTFPSKLKRIVVPLDGSRRARLALPSAARLSRQLDAPVHLISVSAIDKYSYALSAGFSLAAYDELAESGSRQLRAMLRAVEMELSSQGIEVSAALYTGTVAQAIQDALRPGDLIVMASHGRSGIRRWMLGSVAEQLIRKGTAPVMLVPALDLIEHDEAASNTVASLQH